MDYKKEKGEMQSPFDRFSSGTHASGGERPVWQTPAVSVLSLTKTLAAGGQTTDGPGSSRS